MNGAEILDFVLTNQITIGQFGGKYRAGNTVYTGEWANTPRDAVRILMQWKEKNREPFFKISK